MTRILRLRLGHAFKQPLGPHRPVGGPTSLLEKSENLRRKEKAEPFSKRQKRSDVLDALGLGEKPAKGRSVAERQCNGAKSSEVLRGKRPTQVILSFSLKS